MKIKKLVAMVLTLVMLLGLMPIGAINLATTASAKTIEEYSVGDIIEFGSYPQSEVKDSTLISVLEAAGKSMSWVSYNYYSGTGNEYDGQMKPDEGMMYYKDILYNGNKYRAVKIGNRYRPNHVSGNSYSVSGKNGYGICRTYYFKFERLKWRVLDPSEGFVMCNTAIDAQAYNNYIVYGTGSLSSSSRYYGNSDKTYYASDWANSSIRAWLNNDFYNTAFTFSEKSQIGTTCNNNISTTIGYSSVKTNDKVFLLSYNEVLFSGYGFNSKYSAPHIARRLKLTDYAKCQGGYQDTSESYYGNSCWLLRTPIYSYGVASVSYDGVVFSGGLPDVGNTYFGIVPAFKFNPKSIIPETESEIYAEKFDPQSSSPTYQLNGRLEKYTIYTVLNNPNGNSYAGDITINSKKYNVKENLLSVEKAERLKGKDILCHYDINELKITAIAQCRDFSDLNQTDVANINEDIRTSVKIEKQYKWSDGKLYSIEDKNEVLSIPFKIDVYNSIPSEYFDLSENCKSNTAFDYVMSSVSVSGISNCSKVNLLNDYSKTTVKLGESGSIYGNIVLPSKFKFDKNESEKTVTAEYELITQSGEKIYGIFQTVIKNYDYIIETQYEASSLANTVSQLKKVSTTAISLGGLKDIGFTSAQIKYLENLVLVELSLYTMPKESLDDYVSKKVMEKVFGAKDWIDVLNGSMKIVVNSKYEGRDIQVEIVCDIHKYSLMNRTFGNYTNLNYYAYNLDKKGNREKTYFKDGACGLSVSADVEAFAKAATDLALGQIKSASKTLLSGYEEVEKLIFGDTALKILSAAGYNSVFDAGWEMYVNKSKEFAYHCPVDIYVYDNEGKLCGAIENNEVTLDTSDDVDLNVINDEKIVTLWDDGYYIKTLSNCNGTLNINVREKGYVNGDIRELTFENIPLEIGTLYKQGCGNDYYDDAGAYSVEALNGEKIEATTDTLITPSAAMFSVTYDANGGSASKSSESVREGEYILLPTATKARCKFLGWSTTNNNNIHEFEADSVLKITADTTLFAVWSNLSAKSVSINDIEMKYKNSAKINPKIVADEDVEYSAEYKSSNTSVATVDKDGNIYATGRGTATITCTVTDEYGNIVNDTCTVTVKFSFGQWLIWILLFGFLWY